MILSIAAFLTVFFPSDTFPEWRPVRFSQIRKEEIFWVEDEPWRTRERPPGRRQAEGTGDGGGLANCHCTELQKLRLRWLWGTSPSTHKW